MERQKKIIDSSIIVKWFVNEKGSDKAMQLKEQHLENQIVIIVPELIFFEVLNALRFKEKDEETLKEIRETLWDIQFFIVHTNTFILDKTIEISLKYNLSIYDATYAALSQIYGCPLITEDKKLKKFPSAVSL